MVSIRLYDQAEISLLNTNKLGLSLGLKVGMRPRHRPLVWDIMTTLTFSLYRKYMARSTINYKSVTKMRGQSYRTVSLPTKVLNARSAAEMVSSIWVSPWAMDMKPASKAEGAK